MTPHAFDVEDVDPSGALTETLLASQDAGLTRGGAFKAALAGFGGATLLGGLTASEAAAAPKISKKNDLKILAFALVAEQLGAAFYDEAVDHGKLSGQTLAYARKARADERAHVKAVSAQIRTLGGKPAKAPRFTFHGTTKKQSTFQTTASAIESLCVEVLNGAGPLVTDSTLAAAGALVSVEARQVTWINLIIDAESSPIETFALTRTGKRTDKQQNPAFDGAVTLGQAMAAVKRTKFVPALSN